MPSSSKSITRNSRILRRQPRSNNYKGPKTHTLVSLGPLCFCVEESSVQRKPLTQAFNFLAHTLLNTCIVDPIEYVRDPISNRFHLGLFHSARRQSRRADANP